MKLPILLELHRRAQLDPTLLKQRLTFSERFRVGGSGVLKNQASGQDYSLQQLAEWMIGESDNIASDMLLEHLGQQAIQDQLPQWGLRQTTVQRKIFAFAEIEKGRDNYISARDAALMLQIVAADPWMTSILQKTRRRDLIPAKLPSHLNIAHKTGQLQGTLHDAAIIDGSPAYILVILSEGPEAECRELLQNLSYEIYQATQGK